MLLALNMTVLATLAVAQTAPDSVPLYANLGRLHHAIATKVPRAPQYFDQGMIHSYGCNHEEAINSFRYAAKLDPDCAMCYWGVAFALGPYINAIRIQDQLAYDEPPPWYYSVRHSLGAVLLAAKRPAEATQVYRDDLQRNPENGWSLFGLAQALRAEGKTAEAAAVDTRFTKAWARADVTLTDSRF